MVSTGKPIILTTMLVMTNATMEPGMMVSLPRKANLFFISPGVKCCQTTMMTSVATATAIA